MGVPSFFKWLCAKYPRVVIDVVEEEAAVVDDVKIPVDTSKPNPNHIEFDNLYLDMNGIIHPCCHPEDKAAPADENEMILKIFEYIDRIFAMVRPRKTLYMAIDGVAPRAKMNQQRSRRFRASKEAHEKTEMADLLRDQWKEKGQHGRIPPPLPPAWDSNVITPGTPFMAKLSESLHFYIQKRLTTDPGWKNVKVIFSDAKVPGEGEHKIMQFIRVQRSQPNYDPNTRHCMYGMDADLIMLGLASHDPYFSIVREKILGYEDKLCVICNQKGHTAGECKGEAKEQVGEFGEQSKIVEKPFQFMHLNILREYLEYDLYCPNLPFGWDFERMIDDWVLMCFFVGNDFLPHLPSLEIRENAIGRMVGYLKKVLPSLGGYLCDRGRINLSRLDVLLGELAQEEDTIFRRRKQRNDSYQSMQKKKADDEAKKLITQTMKSTSIVEVASVKRKHEENFDRGATNTNGNGSSHTGTNEDAKRGEGASDSDANNAAAQLLKQKIKRKKTSVDESDAGCAVDKKPVLVKAEAPVAEAVLALPVVKAGSTAVEDAEVKEAELLAELEAADEDGGPPQTFEDSLKKMMDAAATPTEKPDQIMLGENGWRDRYYKVKMDLDKRVKSHAETLDYVFRSYTEGLQWVLAYYYRGTASWSWYYPYHYAPMASDLVNIDRFGPIVFEQGKPFSPFGQLMGVLPTASAHALPSAVQTLMTDPDSLIADFYPSDFELDLNGKKFTWQAVALLPFIDEHRLLRELKNVESTFSEEELVRDSEGEDFIFVHSSHPLAKQMLQNCENVNDAEAGSNLANQSEINTDTSSGLAGFLHFYKDTVLPGQRVLPKQLRGSHVIEMVEVVSSVYKLPKAYEHLSILLPGLKTPPKVLNEKDVKYGNRGRGLGNELYPGSGGRQNYNNNNNHNINITNNNNSNYNNYNNNNYKTSVYNHTGAYRVSNSQYSQQQQQQQQQRRTPFLSNTNASWSDNNQLDMDGGVFDRGNRGDMSFHEQMHRREQALMAQQMPGASQGYSSFSGGSYGVLPPGQMFHQQGGMHVPPPPRLPFSGPPQAFSSVSASSSSVYGGGMSSSQPAGAPGAGARGGHSFAHPNAPRGGRGGQYGSGGSMDRGGRGGPNYAQGPTRGYAQPGPQQGPPPYQQNLNRRPTNPYSVLQ